MTRETIKEQAELFGIKVVVSSANVNIVDSDIATIEVLHDLLLFAHGYSLDFVPLKRARELASKMYKAIGWVDCENSLPKTEGEYLTCYKDNDRQTVQYFDGRVWGYLGTVKPNVTHWTNLPPAPNADINNC